METIFISHVEDCNWQQKEDFKDLRWKYFVDSSQSNSHGLSCGIIQIPVRAELKLHFHIPQEIYIIRAGEGLLLGDDKNNQRVAKDSIVYIPRNYLHGLRNIGMIPLEVIWIFPTDCWEEVKYVFDK